MARNKQEKALITILINSLISSAALTAAPAAFATKNIEQETALISKLLKPISDDDWKNIAGPKTTEKYEVIKGDNLFNISQRLFGDPKYWPKIWALNNSAITNPHIITPGTIVAFMPGSGVSLPAISIAAVGEPTISEPASHEPAAAKQDVAKNSKSTEWKNLPPQPWESVSLVLPPEVDAQGFDQRNRINMRPSRGMNIQVLATSSKMPAFGEIIGSRSEAQSLTLGDTVYIEPNEQIQVGDTYAITQEPTLLKSRKSDRVGYSYQFLGRVKIIGVKDNLFIGTITAGEHFIPRGSMIVASPPRIKTVVPIPGSRPIEGIIMRNNEISTSTLAQHKLAFIDRGSDDDVAPGMVFRVYQHQDPGTNKKVSDSDFIIDADIMVVHTTERFSTGFIIKSLSPITENSTAVLLTNISDLTNGFGFKERSTEEISRDDELDELDKMDSSGLGKHEKRELKQLERWNENAPAPTSTPTTIVEPTPPPPPPPAPEPTPESTPESTPEPTPESTPALETPPETPTDPNSEF